MSTDHLHLRGAGGAEWDQLVPSEPDSLGLFRSQVASGFLTPLDDDGNPWTPDEVAAWLADESVGGEATGEKSDSASSPAPTATAADVPTGNIDDVLAWVGADHERSATALEVEQAKGDKARSTLVEHLTRLPHDVPHQPADAEPNDEDNA